MLEVPLPASEVVTMIFNFNKGMNARITKPGVQNYFFFSLIKALLYFFFYLGLSTPGPEYYLQKPPIAEWNEKIDYGWRDIS